MGESYGHYGECFAIPTKDKNIQSMPLKRIGMYIEGFKAYAEGHPEIIFKVTQIGCGLAGFTKEEIAPFFIGSPSNCLFDTAWMSILGRNYTYWGTG